MAGMSNIRGTKSVLAFGLVKCPVALYKTSVDPKEPVWDAAGPNGGGLSLADDKATEASDDKATEASSVGVAGVVGRPLDSDLAVPEAADTSPRYVEDETGVVIGADEVRRGVRYADGRFLDLTDQLAEIDAATKLEEMRVVGCMRVEQVSRDRIEGSYFVAPDGAGGPKVLRLLFEALRKQHRVGVVKWTARSKQSLGVLVPHPQTCSLLLVKMRWACDMREAPSKACEPRMADVSEREIEVACELVEALSYSRAESLDELKDDRRVLRAELLAKAEAGEVFRVPERAVGDGSEDLLGALHASRESMVSAA